MTTCGGKLLSSFYELYSGVAFLSMMVVFAAPILHRLLHKHHPEKDEDRESPKGLSPP